MTLREITRDTVVAVTKLSVGPWQQRDVASNAMSLAEALFSDEALYRAVCADEVHVNSSRVQCSTKAASMRSPCARAKCEYPCDATQAKC